MKKWVKQELKKNPAEKAVLSVIKFVRNNRNGVIAAFVMLAAAGTGGGLILRSRAADKREAVKLFAAAQADYSRFNYEDSAEKAAGVREKYPAAGISDQALYLEGLSYFKLDNLAKASETLKSAVDRFPKSKILPEILLALGEVLEEGNEYDEALHYYGRIPERHYLEPAGISGTARIHELAGSRDLAVEAYTRIRAHFTDTYWADFAMLRLEALGEAPQIPVTDPEFIPFELE